MNEDFLHIERIEKYVYEEMALAERKAFEKNLQTDATLKQEFILFQDMMNSVELLGDEQVTQDIQSVQTELKSEGFFEKVKIAKVENKQQQTATIIPLFRRLAIAASILFLGIVSFLLWPNNPSYEQIYATFYSPEKNVLPIILDDLESLGLTDVNKVSKTSLATGLAFYENKAYSNAITSLETHLQTYPTDKLAQLYLGLSAMEIKDYTKSIVQLEALQSAEDFSYTTIVDWYLALSYSQSKDKLQRVKIIPLLEKIANGENAVYADKAKKMLAKIQ